MFEEEKKINVKNRKKNVKHNIPESEDRFNQSVCEDGTCSNKTESPIDLDSQTQTIKVKYPNSNSVQQRLTKAHLHQCVPKFSHSPKDATLITNIDESKQVASQGKFASLFSGFLNFGGKK